MTTHLETLPEDRDYRVINPMPESMMRRVLDALEIIVKFDESPEMRAAATRRYLDLTNPNMKEASFL